MELVVVVSFGPPVPALSISRSVRFTRATFVARQGRDVGAWYRLGRVVGLGCRWNRRALMATTEALIHFASSKKSSSKFDVHALELLKQINEVVYETLSHVIEDNPFDSDIEEGVTSITQEYTRAFHNEWDDHVRPIFESWGKDS